MMDAKRPSLLTIAQLRSEDASLVDKLVVFESQEYHIIYMTKMNLAGLLD